MATYDLGDAVTITTTVTDDSGTLTNTTMALTVTAPDGTTSTPTPTNPSTGNYEALISPAQVGTWFFKWVGTGAVVVTDSGEFTILDPAPPAYATLSELKDQLKGRTSATDEQLMRRLLAASRRIDDDCGRRFWRDQTTSARIYRITHDRIIVVDDFAIKTGLVVETGYDPNFATVQSQSYRVGPDNSFARNRPGYILERHWRQGFWPLGHELRVTAQWGWPLIPDPIHEACLLLASRLYSRIESPSGVAGFNDLGPIRISRTDPDYDALIGPYVQPEP